MLDRIDLTRRALRALPSLLSLLPDSRSTVADRIEACARAHPRRPFALQLGASGELVRTSYGELNARANRVAAWAASRGLGRGSVVALLMENRCDYVAVWAGLAKLGITTALLNTHLAGGALRHALSAAGAGTAVVGSECLERFGAAAGGGEAPLEAWVLRDPDGAAADPRLPEGLLDLDADLSGRPAGNPDPSARAGLRCRDDLFYIYTSGTTGLPKAARFSHQRFLGAGVGCAILLRMGSADVHYCALPLYHSAGGVMMVSTVLAAGATLALRRRFSASAFWDDCRRFGATRFQYIGEFCRYLLNQPPRADDRDHRVRMAIGNGLRPDIWEEFQRRFGLERIIEFYGATESNVAFVNLGDKVGSVGRIPFGRLGQRLGSSRLVRYDVETDRHPRDERGRCIECGPGEPGELIARISEGGVLRFEGYTSREATEKKILRDVFAPGDAWFRSGDLLQRDTEGWHYFVDRVGDTFRWKGENVSTQEVAELLAGFPGLQMANVYGVEVPGHGGRAGMAALVLEDPARFDPAEFFAFASARLPRYATPLFLRLVGEAEVTGTLKLRKVGLQAEGFDPDRTSDPLWLRDDDAETYVPLTREVHEQVLSGERRL